MIVGARERVFRTVNKELIELYWKVGEYISLRVVEESWGKGVVASLASFLKEKEPDLRGFSARNLWRMKQFFETYRDFPKLSPLLTEIPWSAHLHLLSKTKSTEEKEFYLHLARREKYSVRQLERQIDSALFERVIISETKLPTALTELRPELNKIYRDTYALDFLNLPDSHSEADLQKSILKNLRKFIVEIGNDFTFMGEEFRVQVGKHDYFIDLVFYHRELRCLVAFELKIDEFKPEYIGKMNFYLEALDRDVRKEHENPSVGIILCKEKDQEVVEYALSRSLSPTMISEYQTKLIAKSTLQSKLHELFEHSELRREE